MTGAVLGAAIVVAILLIVVVGASPIFLVPIALAALAVIIGAPMLAAADRSGPGPADTPSTSEASYDPVDDPGARPSGR
jgi:hypothetical protein